MLNQKDITALMNAIASLQLYSHIITEKTLLREYYYFYEKLYPKSKWPAPFFHNGKETLLSFAQQVLSCQVIG